jgi:lipopolysaccharide/colanic/teichoic acid biosynthesis glycosyltransferase
MKRAVDIGISGVLLVVASPLVAALAVLIRWRLGRPVLFVQQRPGQHGVPFRIHKFRTMTEARGPDGVLLPDEQRLTSLGRFLRSTSLDELPELWDVLRGDMSLVGPRPLLMEYLDRYTPEEARRHDVKPGITGWAQVNGRNETSWEERLALDVWYVEHHSLSLDLKILVKTLAAVVARRGVSAPGHSTMPELPADRALGTLNPTDAPN